MNKNELPIYKHESEIIQKIKNNQIVIISGDTGCGKTTQLPQIISKNFPIHGKIGITQPRRISALTVCQRVAFEMKSQIGIQVGYEIRFDKKISQLTKIKFMTEGILLKEFLNDRKMKTYDFIIIDEAHERGLNSDILLGLIKQMTRTNKKCKIIIMSATLQTKKFQQFFQDLFLEIRVALVEIKGRFFPIEIYNLENPAENYLDSCYNIILQIHYEQKKGDILVFLTGREEIEEMCEKLIKIQNIPKFDNMIVIPLYSQLPTFEQQKAFKKYKNKRKIILSTNIAETAITIDGVRYVIDSGFVKMKFYDENQYEKLMICPVSKSSAIQRAGRCGRNQEGKCYRLYTKQSYDELEEFNKPEILRSNLDIVTLHLKALDVVNIYKFPLIDQPKSKEYAKSIKTLIKLNALNEKQKITYFGRQILQFPLDPFSSFCLLQIQQENNKIQNDIISIISILNSDKIILFRDLLSKGRQQELYQRFLYKDSDHLTYLNIFYQYVIESDKKRFCKHYCLRMKSLENIIKVREQLIQIFYKTKKIKIENNFDIFFNKKKLLQILQNSFFNNKVQQKYSGKYTVGLKLAKIHPESVLFLKKQKPQKVLYYGLIKTNNLYLTTVSSLDQLNNQIKYSLQFK